MWYTSSETLHVIFVRKNEGKIAFSTFIFYCKKYKPRWKNRKQVAAE